MNEFQKIMIAAARMADAAYFDLDDMGMARLSTAMGNAIDAVTGAADDQSPYPDPVVSIACAAPAQVDMTCHTGVPLLILTHANGAREWQVDADANMLLVASNLITGAVRVVRPMDHDKRRKERGRSTDAPVPTAFAANCTSTGAQRVNLLEFGFDASAGLQVALSAILYDVCSNVVTVRVTTGDDATLRQPSPAVASDCVQPIPFDGPSDRAGCALRVAGSVMSGDAPFFIEGYVRLALPPCAPISCNGGGRLMPATLLFVQKDRRAAESLHLLLSVEEVNGMAEVGFRYDLRQAGGMLEGTSMIYLVAGDQIAGPYAVSYG